jgi:3',5'-nucleoside bisphosphate phosphatase
MKTFKADLHIHTILSPCASLEMSPVNIVRKALEKGIDIIGITDHNSTRQCRIVMKEAETAGLKVYPGVEITTREEIHCLAYFNSLDDADRFQEYLDEELPFIKNDPTLFGYQVVVDEHENIVFEEEKLLISALKSGIDQVEVAVHQLNGVFIPAHVNKPKDSIISQLGFIPDNLNADAFEITRHTNRDTFLKVNRLSDKTQLINNSDAHMLESVGENVSFYEMESTDFSEFCLALKNASGRKVVIQ